MMNNITLVIVAIAALAGLFLTAYVVKRLSPYSSDSTMTISATGAGMILIKSSVMEDLVKEISDLRESLDQMERRMRDQFGDTLTDFIINGNH